MHHVIIVLGSILCLVGGYSCAGLTMLAFLCESSSIFLNCNEFFKKEELDKGLHTVNSLCFFVAYTCMRVMLFPYIWFKTMNSILIVWPHVTTARKIGHIGALLCFTGVILLNYFWYYLILRKLRKLMIKQGILKGSNKSSDNCKKACGKEAAEFV